MYVVCLSCAITHTMVNESSLSLPHATGGRLGLCLQSCFFLADRQPNLSSNHKFWVHLDMAHTGELIPQLQALTERCVHLHNPPPSHYKRSHLSKSENEILAHTVLSRCKEGLRAGWESLCVHACRCMCVEFVLMIRGSGRSGVCTHAPRTFPLRSTLTTEIMKCVHGHKGWCGVCVGRGRGWGSAHGTQ
jgi:hypothetical protein